MYTYKIVLIKLTNNNSNKYKKGVKRDRRVSTNSTFQIPTSIFKDRKVSVLEALVEYLKDKKGLSYHEISILINRDERNIWTVYNRAKKKRKNERGS